MCFVQGTQSLRQSQVEQVSLYSKGEFLTVMPTNLQDSAVQGCKVHLNSTSGKLLGQQQAAGCCIFCFGVQSALFKLITMTFNRCRLGHRCLI